MASYLAVTIWSIFSHGQGKNRDKKQGRLAQNVDLFSHYNIPKYTLAVFNMFRVFCRYNLNFS